MAYDSTSLICWNCIPDEGLKEFVKTKGVNDTCECCDSKGATLSIEELAKVIDPFFRKYFTTGSYERSYDAEVGYPIDEQGGDCLELVISDMVGDVEYQEAIIDALIALDDFDPRDGDEPFYGTDINYEPISHGGTTPMDDWESTSIQLKTRRRFFSEYARTFFDSLFADVENLHAWSNGKQVPVVKVLSSGTEVWRARSVDSPKEAKKFLQKPDELLGAPPAGKARAGRMNATGISVFYGALDEETCLAEMRPSIGGLTLVADFATSAPLRLLDFQRLERAYDSGGISYFRDDYIEKKNKVQFLRRLHALISAPVLPGHDNDYLVTQVLTEYLAHICKTQLHGLTFSSTQRKGGTNVVLFLDQERPSGPRLDLFDEETSKKRPAEFKGKNVQLMQTESVTYSAKKTPRWNIGWSSVDEEDGD